DAYLADGATADAKENLAVTSSATIPNPNSYLRPGFDFSNLHPTPAPDPAPEPPASSDSDFFSSITKTALDGLDTFYRDYIAVGINAIAAALTPLISYVGGDLGVANKVTTFAIESSASAVGSAQNPITGAQVLAGGASILTITNQALAHIGNGAKVNQDT